MTYNVKAIMTRAWEIKKQDIRNDFALCLVMAWGEAKTSKATPAIVCINRDGHKLTFDTRTGYITGDTYPVKNWIKGYLDGKWDSARRAWHVTGDILNYTGVKGIIEDVAATKRVVSERLVNGNDGFYSVTRYSDGTTSRFFVG